MQARVMTTLVPNYPVIDVKTVAVDNDDKQQKRQKVAKKDQERIGRRYDQFDEQMQDARKY